MQLTLDEFACVCCVYARRVSAHTTHGALEPRAIRDHSHALSLLFALLLLSLSPSPLLIHSSTDIIVPLSCFLAILFISQLLSSHAPPSLLQAIMGVHSLPQEISLSLYAIASLSFLF